VLGQAFHVGTGERTATSERENLGDMQAEGVYRYGKHIQLCSAIHVGKPIDQISFTGYSVIEHVAHTLLHVVRGLAKVGETQLLDPGLVVKFMVKFEPHSERQMVRFAVNGVDFGRNYISGSSQKDVVNATLGVRGRANTSVTSIELVVEIGMDKAKAVNETL